MTFYIQAYFVHYKEEYKDYFDSFLKKIDLFFQSFPDIYKSLGYTNIKVVLLHGHLKGCLESENNLREIFRDEYNIKKEEDFDQIINYWLKNKILVLFLNGEIIIGLDNRVSNLEQNKFFHDLSFYIASVIFHSHIYIPNIFRPILENLLSDRQPNYLNFKPCSIFARMFALKYYFFPNNQSIGLVADLIAMGDVFEERLKTLNMSKI